MGYSTPLVNNLEIEELFKDENKEKGVGVINLINQLVQVLKRELVQLRDSIQELKKVGELDLVELQDKGQPSYIVIYILSVLIYLYTYILGVPIYPYTKPLLWEELYI